MKLTLKQKGIAAIICGGAALLWLVLWLVFPMPFYSLFFADMIGSNVTLVIIAVLLTFPANYLFSRLLRADINYIAHLAVNIVGMVAFIYVYSIFRYTAIYWIIIALLVHTIGTVVVFMKNKKEEIPHIREKQSRLKLIIMGAACAIASDCLYLLIFNFMIKIFASDYFA